MELHVNGKDHNDRPIRCHAVKAEYLDSSVLRGYALEICDFIAKDITSKEDIDEAIKALKLLKVNFIK